MNSSFHVPVMPEQVVEYMITNASGIYVDCTLGGGGHAAFLLKHLNNDARYLGIDQDEEALNFAKSSLSQFDQITFIQNNFKNLNDILNSLEIRSVNGILLDLGVSSFQIDSANRGFTYLKDTQLDMRMNQQDSLTAEDVVNNYSEEKLCDVFRSYGEERKSKLIANLIIKEREKQRIRTTAQIKEIIGKVVHPKFRIKSFSRIFQALRIEVNQELQNLKSVLQQSFGSLTKGGRLMVLSYHSLEDRIVKQFLKQKENPCTCPPEFPVCICGNVPEVKILTKKAIRASAAEISKNSRARSALLRVGEKL